MPAEMTPSLQAFLVRLCDLKDFRYDRVPSARTGQSLKIKAICARLGIAHQMPGKLTHITLRAFDSIARFLPQKTSTPQHLSTGTRGEEEAYFYLRRQGYVMIARNYRSPRSRSELDLVGWDGETLCFIEVKTRKTRDFVPAEAAVDAEKQSDLSRVAREFLRKVKGKPSIRFDVVSVYLSGGEVEIELFKDAFRMS